MPGEILRIVTGPNGQENLEIAQAVDVFSSYGVIFLLFHVGLHTCVAELKQVGGAIPSGLPSSACWCRSRSVSSSAGG